MSDNCEKCPVFCQWWVFQNNIFNNSDNVSLTHSKKVSFSNWNPPWKYINRSFWLIIGQVNVKLYTFGLIFSTFYICPGQIQIHQIRFSRLCKRHKYLLKSKIRRLILIHGKTTFNISYFQSFCHFWRMTISFFLQITRFSTLYQLKILLLDFLSWKSDVKLNC